MEQKYSQFRGQPRLPKFAVPKRYDIKLKPDLVACKFSGAVDISVDVVAPTKFIVLNAADLAVHPNSVRFTDQTGSKVLEALVVELCEEDEIVVVEFAENLPIGVGFLCIAFEGTLNDKMKGFYRSSYEHKGEKKNMAVTQFEPADARRCFPCWDEPACKATFKIVLEVPSEVVALSNMPVVEEKVDGNIKTVHYQESPIMSTYLVAVVIGLFDYVEDFTSDGIKVRVYCQVGKANQGKFALDVAVKTLDLYKMYFAVPYSLPKLDMIAIPDFAAGAMENYGLVTYRETALLYDEKHSAASNKQRVATVVAHELAHQWFGNLVTMEWWTHLWLNEGFATWVSYLATDSLFPEWKIWTQFLDESTEGLRLDGLAESHPIEVEINHACEIDEIFDAISYRKGASVIRMLQSYLGPECFQRALASYIKKYACSNAKTEDLWAVLEEESGEPVNKLMNSWTKQKGYPVVAVRVKDQKLEFDQSQFLLSGSHGDGQWIVPITLCCCSYDARKNFLLQAKSESLDTKEFLGCSISQGCLKETGAWIKINVDQTGFYRVKYDDELAGRLRHAIEAKCLSATDRFGILDDSYALCMACQQPLASLLSLMGAYREELEYTVLCNLISISYKIARIAADATPELLGYIEQFFINLFQYPAEKLGWDPKQGESHLDAMLRGELLAALVHFGHDITQDEARRRFDAFLDDRHTALLPPDIRKVAYVAVMQNVSSSSRSGYESLLRVYRETDQSQEKTRILGSLASCPDPDIVLEVLTFVLSSEVRSQDAIFGVHVGIKGRETAWGWLKDNWDHISKTWGSGFLITRFVSSVVSPFSSYEKAKEVEEFFASRAKPSIARTLKQSLERVHINAKWVQSIQNEEHLADIVQELAS
ncbi:Aminopeptidase [Actinidia chinensis var. chinensis]|uniref:Aminopeptidase n=1 Tax=Actinidia chinensis var. chinensis TaxID=1590841 RepID=A0A2R6R269_ACTCC|nr:Aminopeptidase [Actinidia chinensis var. chinensis]